MKRFLFLFKKGLSIRKAFSSLLLIALLLCSITDLQAQTITYVKMDANGDGSSWDNASGDLQLMIDSNAAGGQVWVAGGYYYPAVTGESFHMKEGVEIYGGFPGFGNPGMAERNPALNGCQITANGYATVFLNVDNNLTQAAVLDGFTISNGTSRTVAGGIQNTNSSPTLRNLKIHSCDGINGGGYGEANSNAIVYNVLFYNNFAESGGAISSENSTSVFTNITISGNQASIGGGAFRHSNTASVIQNSVVWGNNNYQTNESQTITAGMPNGLTFINSIVQGSGGDDSWNTAYGSNGGGNIDADAMLKNDYTLKPASPAINSGNTALFPNAAAANDVAGNPRVIQNTIDMGAFEYPDFIFTYFYVKQGANGSGNSWADASGDLQLMINNATAGDQIWVAAGTYIPAGSFTPKEGVSMYGGFPATGNPGMNDRDPRQFISELSSAAVPALSSANAGMTSNTVIDGFKVLTTGATAVSLTGASPVLNNFNISNNTGTAIALINSEAQINSLTAANNTGALGVVSVTGTSAAGNSPSLTNTLIYNNVLTNNGGGIYINQSSPTLTNVTIASNTGSGIYFDQASPAINNSIIYGNVNNNIAGTSSATFTNSLIGGSGGSDNWDTALGTDGGNNIDAEPLFTNAITGDYNLLSGSPAADTGDISLFANAATSKDLAGNLRIIGLSIDMGALESLANIAITYVKQDATGAGTSWDDAIGNLANAITGSSPGDEVWVAQGTFFPENEFFELKEGVKIYGGFPATGNPGMAERDWSTNVSLMSNTAYDPYDYNYILRQSAGGVTTTTLLDGFTITMADGADGTGIYLYEASPTLKNLTITKNTQGGIEMTNSSPVVSNVLLLDNARAGRPALGIEGDSSPVFTNITVTSPENGYLSVFYGCTPLFYNSIIKVGIATSDDSDATFTNCYVEGLGGSENWESSQTDGGNNIDGDLTLLSDGSIMPGSIAVNAGDNTYTNAAGISVDIAGNPRIYDDVVDMGAYEEQGAPIVSIRYVRAGGTGDGSNWDNASGNLQDMIDISQQGNKVLVAAGTYLTREGDYFEMKEGVSIYGGYAPTGDPAVDERDWAVNSTILSGNGNDSGAVIAYELSEESVLDGFVLVNSSGYYATAVYTYESYAIFNNLVIRDNAADSNGGAIYSEDGTPVFNNIVVYNNSSIPIVNYGASPVFNNITISGNTNSAFIHNDYESYPIFNNSILWQDGTVTGEDDSASVFVNSIVKNSGGSNNWNVALGTNGGNNLDTDPLFTNPAADDYTLQESSPAINEGDTTLYENAATSKDLAGNPRLNGAAIDMGAYEKEAAICSIATTWDGTTWSNGIPNSYSYSATFTGNYIQTASETIKACSLTILSGNVEITTGSVLDVKGKVTVADGASLTFMNNAHLVQMDDVVNSGKITSHRNSSDLFRLDYTMWSSPVEMQNLKAFSPFTITNRFYKYNTEANHYVSGDEGGFNALTDSFEEARGYLIRMPQTGSTEYISGRESTVFDGTFTGVPHNGDIDIELSRLGNRFNLVGNPYPSPLNLANFFAGNTESIDGIIYIWRKRNAQEVTSAYVTINSVGDFVSNNQSGADDPDGILQTGQGFIVRAQENAIDTHVHFANTMRSSDTGHDGSFFRNSAVEKHRMWLDLSNSEGFISQMLIGYRTGATMQEDMGIDATSISDGNKSLSSWLNGQPYVIQGRGLPFEDTDTVPLQFKTNAAGEYSINLSRAEGLFNAGQAIYIKDNLTGNLHNVQQGAYDFATEAGTFNNRFEVHYREAPLLSTPGKPFNDSNVVVYKTNRIINISTGNMIIRSVKIFDLQGRLVYSDDNVNAVKKEISNLEIAEQMLIVQVVSADNITINKKIIYQIF